MFVLDTDTLTLAYTEHPRVSEQFHRGDPNEVAGTVITQIEVLRGRFESLLKAENGERLMWAQVMLARSEERFRGLAILPVDAAAAAEFDRLRQQRNVKKIGRA